MSIRRVVLQKFLVMLVAVIMVLPLFSFDSFAQSGLIEGTEVAGSSKSHHREIRELKQMVEELQQKIKELEAQTQETNMRVYEAMSLDEKEGWWNKIRIRTKKGTGLTFETTDGNYKMRMRLRGQFLAQYSDEDRVDEILGLPVSIDGLGFAIRRGRINWDGHAFRPWFKYKIQVGLVREVNLRDLRFDFAYNPQIVPRIGQYKVPFDAESLNSSSALQLVDRSILAPEFTYARDIGVGLHGKFSKMVRYELGIFQGEGRNAPLDEIDRDMLYAARVDFTPIGNDLRIVPNFGKRKALRFGAAVAYNEFDGTDLNFNAQGRCEDMGAESCDATSISLDAQWRSKIGSISGEYIGRWVNGDDLAPGAEDSVYDQGFRIQGGVFVMPKKVELAARYAYIGYDSDVDGPDNSWEITPGINWYLSEDHRWKIQLDYSFIRDEDTDGTELDTNRVRAQLQAYF